MSGPGHEQPHEDAALLVTSRLVGRIRSRLGGVALVAMALLAPRLTARVPAPAAAVG